MLAEWFVSLTPIQGAMFDAGIIGFLIVLLILIIRNKDF